MSAALSDAMPAKARLAIRDLEQRALEPRPEALPDRVDLVNIKMIPELFQPRTGKSQDHIEELAKALRECSDLDPVLIMQVGGWPVLIDGHHRWAAYKRTKGRSSIPVRYFEGTIAEAIAESGKENSKAKLPMQPSDRQDFAWRLTKMGMHSLNETRLAASISKAQAAIMRQTLTKLGPQRAGVYEVWIDAKREARKLDGDAGSVDDDWLHAQAQRYADRLYKEFGTKLSGNLDMLARTLAIHVGPERLSELLEALDDREPTNDGEQVDGRF